MGKKGNRHRKIKSFFRDDEKLSYFSTVTKSLLRCDESHLTVILTSHKDHSLGLDAADLARCEVGKDTYLLADHLLWRVLLCDT